MTEILLLPTLEYKSQYSSSDLASEADDIEYYWASYIDDGDYPLSADTSWLQEVDLSDEDPTTTNEGLQASEDYLSSNYPRHTDYYDAFLVFDERTNQIDGNGIASVGSTSSQAAGSDSFGDCTGYICNPGGATGQHEVGHLYAATHNRCRMYQSYDVITVMSSYGHTSEDCHGRDFEWLNSRSREFYNCVVNDVQEYYDHWNL